MFKLNSLIKEISVYEISRFDCMTGSLIKAKLLRNEIVTISVEHEILNAHKYKNIKRFSFF